MAKTLTTVYKTTQDQYQTTIPKVLAEAMGWEKGDKLRWKINSKSALEVRRVNENDE